MSFGVIYNAKPALVEISKTVTFYLNCSHMYVGPKTGVPYVEVMFYET